MTLVPGARLGTYDILSLIGTGGMGQVYRARDRRLDRDVAIKILPEAFTLDADRLARFRREAKTLAALSHPNLASVHGLEEFGAGVALVMEFVDGADLAALIARGAMPMDDALRIAAQIAEALEAAHDQGIVHRDLKPANVRVRSDGSVKVLDFGLAKSVESATAAAGASLSPTLTSPLMTHGAVILGTAAYMSPEQARGKPVDKRTDIWAFGCVLHEMLTGRRTFSGDEVSDVLASILAREPDIASLPAATPAPIRRLIGRCLQKDRALRLRDIGDARLEIGDAIAGGDDPVAPAAPASTTSRLRERLVWSVAIVVAVIAAGASIATMRPTVTAPEMRVEIATPPSADPWSVAVAPDGRSVVYVATVNAESRLWLRSVETGVARELAGTDGAEAPFWSPDSQSIGFFADGKLKRVSVTDGSAQIVTAAVRGADGTWNRDNVILIASLGRPIQRVPAGGGQPVALSGLEMKGSDFSPYFLPDGKHFLYYVRASPEARGIYIGQIDSTAAPRRLFESDTGAAYAAPGYLLYGLRGTLYGRRFDEQRLDVTGTAFPIAEGLEGVTERSGLSTSATGTIAYRGRTAAVERQFVWFDRAGHELTRVGRPTAAGLSQPSLSPDGQRVAFYAGDAGNVDVWIEDLKSGARTRLTSEPSDEVFPIWAPDGTRVAFSSNRNGVHDLYVKRATGGGSEELLFESRVAGSPTDWSRDGRYLLFTSFDPVSGVDVWALPMDGSRKPLAVARSPFNEQSGQFSPDGNWIAYESNESGRGEIYVQSFPSADRKMPVSTGGGSQPRWSRDGKELFFVSRTGVLTVVPVRVNGADRLPEIGLPRELFTPPLGGAVQRGDVRHQYMLSADGQRILVAAVKEPAPTPISLILNWKPKT